jgi:predicted RNA methylase
MKQTSLTPEAINILKQSSIADTVLFLPDTQLDRKLYTEINKALVNAGGKWNKSKKGFVFATPPNIETLIQAKGYVDKKKQYAFFPTPQPVVEFMLSCIAIDPESATILEPSAGMGNIALALREEYPNNPLFVCELNPEHQDCLREQGFEVVGDDFLQHQGTYDYIIANPPFDRGLDVEHVNHMLDCLNTPGTLVAIMSPGISFKQDKKTTALRKRLEDLGADIFPLPAGSFKESGTSVNTVVVLAHQYE